MTAGSPAADPQGAPAEILEHRLALVMNGGVSLAVWMGGVACRDQSPLYPQDGIPTLPLITAQRTLNSRWCPPGRRAA